MSRYDGVIDQSKGVGGSDAQLDALDIANEPLQLGKPVSGQSGAAASITAVVSGVVTMTGLTGMTSDSLGRFLTIANSGIAANDGTFEITAILSGTSVNYVNASAVAPDTNNGSISWAESEPYSLEDDLNYARTNIRLVKGTLSWYDEIPTYRRPTARAVDVSTNLDAIAGNTLDAKALLDSKFQENIPVSPGDTFVTLTDIGNLKHADSSDVTGVPISDGYDAGREEALFAVVVDADIDGYTDGSELRVLYGVHAGERIFGRTRAGSSTSPDSVEVAFYSTPIDDWSLTMATPYTWEADQPSEVNICFSYRERLDRLDEAALRKVFIKGALLQSNATSSGGGGGGGISENQHKALRHLIHFIDNGPADGFATGAFYEILPAGNPFPTSYTWYTSVAKTDRIVELLVTRGGMQNPITEIWNMYDTDGSTIVATVTDSITYSGPFEVSRTRAIS